MRLFGSDRIIKIFERFGLKEGDELQHPWLNKSIETAQKRVEQHHFGIRKRTLDFDDVMNKQREIIYKLRKDALLSDNPHDVLFSIIEQVIQGVIEERVLTQNNKDDNGFDKEPLLAYLNLTFPIEFKSEELTAGFEGNKLMNIEALTLSIVDRIEQAYLNFHRDDPAEDLDYLRRQTVLEAIDRLWQEHLYAMDHLRSSMSLRVYAQKDPLVEYKNEAFNIFKSLMDKIYRQVATNLFTMTLNRYSTFEELLKSMPMEMQHQILEQYGMLPDQEGTFTPQIEEEPNVPEEAVEIPITYHRETPKVGRNDLCPCGSGKKYKKCCGKE